jgi:hypothetical protein
MTAVPEDAVVEITQLRTTAVGSRAADRRQAVTGQ